MSGVLVWVNGEPESLHQLSEDGSVLLALLLELLKEMDEEVLIRIEHKICNSMLQLRI